MKKEIKKLIFFDLIIAVQIILLGLALWIIIDCVRGNRTDESLTPKFLEENSKEPQYLFILSDLISSHKKEVGSNYFPELAYATEASWYSKKHCLGCNPQRIMANGEVLDDNKHTCAYNYANLGDKLILKYGDKQTWCIVTDRIGIDKRIDLTPIVFKKLAFLDKGIINIKIIK